MIEPAPPYPDTPRSAIGRRVADVLTTLRKLRKGSKPKQIGTPRKARQRRSGELTLTEFSARVGLGPRELRRKLLAVGLLQTEIVVRDRGNVAPEYQHTRRLTAAAFRGGLGRRLEPRSGPAYDVLTPKGQEWVANNLSRSGEERRPSRRHEVRDQVRQLLAQGKNQAEISRLTGFSRSLVSYHARRSTA